MNERTQVFKEVYDSEYGKETLALGEKIKKLDKSNDRRLQLVILLSVISMTLLGYFALGTFGAVVFLGITLVASFALYYSSKKNVLLKYLTFYRSRIPMLIARADNAEVKAEEIPDSDFVSTLSDKGKLAYRMCHRYDSLYIGFAKFMVGSEPILQGLLYEAEGDGLPDDEAVRAIIGDEYDFVVKAENGKALLFIFGIEDYLDGRVEMKNDLTLDALTKQYEYYLWGRDFEALVKAEVK